MKHLAIALLAVAVSLCPAPVEAKKASAAAQNIDFSAMRCRDFINDVSEASEEDVAALLLWLDGYLSGVSGDTVLRFDGLEHFGTSLVEHCSANGKDRLLDAARKVGIR